MGQVNAWEGMPKLLLTHYFHFSHPFFFTLESFSSFLHGHKFILVFFSKWVRKIYVFLAFSWILQWLRTFFTFNEWPRCQIHDFGVCGSRFGSRISIVTVRNKKHDLGLRIGLFWPQEVIKRLLKLYFSPWCFLHLQIHFQVSQRFSKDRQFVFCCVCTLSLV